MLPSLFPLTLFSPVDYRFRHSAIGLCLLLGASMSSGAGFTKDPPPPDKCWASKSAPYFGDDVTRKALRNLLQTRSQCRIVGLSVRIAQTAVFSLGYDRDRGVMLRAVHLNGEDHNTWEAWKFVTDSMVIGVQDQYDDMHLGPLVMRREAEQMAAGSFGRLVLSHLPK